MAGCDRGAAHLEDGERAELDRADLRVEQCVIGRFLRRVHQRAVHLPQRLPGMRAEAEVLHVHRLALRRLRPPQDGEVRVGHQLPAAGRPERAGRGQRAAAAAAGSRRQTEPRRHPGMAAGVGVVCLFQRTAPSGEQDGAGSAAAGAAAGGRGGWLETTMSYAAPVSEFAPAHWHCRCRGRIVRKISDVVGSRTGVYTYDVSCIYFFLIIIAF